MIAFEPKSLRRFSKASLFCLLFSLLYECFSHGVYSRWMLLAFLIPLLGGVLLSLMLGRGLRLGETARALYAGGVATLTAGSLFRGVLEIYGTTSRLEKGYWIAACLLLLAALAGAIPALRNEN